MKKIIISIIFCLMLLPFYVNASDEVIVSDIKLKQKSETVEGFENPKINGLTINFGEGKFTTPSSFVQYDITFKNNTNVDYTFEKWLEKQKEENISPGISVKGKNDIISFGLLCENESLYTVKANQTNTCILTITYGNRIEKESLTDGKYEENFDVNFTLVSSDNSTEVSSTKNNPGTNNNYLLLLVVVVSIIAVTVILIAFRKNKSVNNVLLFIILTMIFTVSTFALSNISFNMSGKVIVDPIPEFCYYNIKDDSEGLKAQYFSFEKGTTWREYLNSEQNTEFQVHLYDTNEHLPVNYSDKKFAINYIGFPTHKQCDNNCGSYTSQKITSFDEEIQDRFEGCYTYIAD